MLDDHPAEFRERVLRRVAERDDLDAVAREFGLSADLVFRWLKDHAADGPPLASRRPPSPLPSSAGAAAVPHAPARERRRDSPELIILLFASVFIPLGLLFLVGHVRPSRQAESACLPVWIILGLAVFAWLWRRVSRIIEDEGGGQSLQERVALGLFVLVPSILATVLMALALPAIPHRLFGTPVEWRTQVSGKVVRYGKNTSHCLSTPVFDARVGAFDWCTDVDTFSRARVGETIVLHGSTSWFGFLQDRFELIPDDPK